MGGSQIGLGASNEESGSRGSKKYQKGETDGKEIKRGIIRLNGKGRVIGKGWKDKVRKEGHGVENVRWGKERNDKIEEKK